MRYIMFSRQYLAGHPRAKEPTFFPQKTLSDHWTKEIPEKYILDCPFPEIYNDALWDYEVWMQPKGHTIRPGNRFKEGDIFSPRIWVGAPYRSKQFEFMPPIKVVATFDIKIQYTNRRESLCIWLNNNLVQMIRPSQIKQITVCMPQNDGLTPVDWLGWFPEDFTGQVICWNVQVAKQYKHLIKT